MATPIEPEHNGVERTSPAAQRRAVRRTSTLPALAAVLAVGTAVIGIAVGKGDAEATPAGTVRAFLTSAVIENNGVVACRYLTAYASGRVEEPAAPDAGCHITLSSARLRLGGRSIAAESDLKQLDYRVEQRGAHARVTVATGGAALTFGVRKATAAELREFRAPPTPWRIDSGIDRLVAGA